MPSCDCFNDSLILSAPGLLSPELFLPALRILDNTKPWTSQIIPAKSWGWKSSPNLKSMSEQKEQAEIPGSPSPWRNKRQMADHYGCDIRTITNFMRRRILPYMKIGRFVRFNLGECELAMEKYKRGQ